MTWVLVFALAAGTIALKVVGPLLAGGATPPAALTRVIALLTPALLTGLVVTSTFASSRHLDIDARAAGVGLGLALLLLRTPLLVALVAAAVTVAAIRMLA
jgi:protein involved in polysaccharide export with SLBB domain